MVNILIVDDCDEKILAINGAIADFDENLIGFVDSAKSVKSAKEYLREKKYSLLILDLNLPINDNGRAIKDGGAIILRDVFAPKDDEDVLFAPDHVVGLTSYLDIKNSVKGEFERLGDFRILEYSVFDSGSLDSVISKIRAIYRSKGLSFRLRGFVNYIITIHGIRTNAFWQRQLKSSISKYDEEARIHNFTYGYFSVIEYIFPFTRKRLVEKFSRQINDLSLNDETPKKIHFISHSFGTYILIKTLQRINLKSEDVANIILAGSVLSGNYPLHKVINTYPKARLVNECGVNDLALLFNSLFVPFSGMAGKLGFVGLSSSRFVNRYHSGGHSLYFKSDSLSDTPLFMSRNWIPILLTDRNIEDIDMRPKTGFISGLSLFLAQNAYIVKMAFYFILLVSIWNYFFM